MEKFLLHRSFLKFLIFYCKQISLFFVCRGILQLGKEQEKSRYGRLIQLLEAVGSPTVVGSRRRWARAGESRPKKAVATSSRRERVAKKTKSPKRKGGGTVKVSIFLFYFIIVVEILILHV
jgi:hypothetical protein